MEKIKMKKITYKDIKNMPDKERQELIERLR